jgi:hypothetical protein
MVHTIDDEVEIVAVAAIEQATTLTGSAGST